MDFKLLVLFFFIACLYSTTSAQSQITEINGRKAELKEDGTWEYLDEDEYEEEDDDDEDEDEEYDSFAREQERRKKFESQRANSANRKPTAYRAPKCSDLLKADFLPDFSGLQTVSEEVFIIGKNSFFMNWSYNKAEGLLLIIQFKAPQCISNTDKISFSFRDLSENFTVSNIGENNCDGMIKINDPKAIKTLKAEKIKAISIRTGQGTTTDYLSEATARNFIAGTKCIYNTTMSK